MLGSQFSAWLGKAALPPVEPQAPAVTGPAAGPGGRTGVIRPLYRNDIPQICDLFARTFRPGRNVRRADIEACFEQTYLTSPGDRIKPASLVDIGPGGRVNGFMGMITLAARFGDKALRGGVLGNFMAYDADRAKAAVRLVRATVAQDLDFVFTDTANRTSLDLSRAMRFNVLPLQSLEWVKVLRPCGTANALLGRSVPALGAALTPLARIADSVARRAAFASVPDLAQDGIVDRPIDAAAFAAKAPAFVERFCLKPEWHGEELVWLLDQAARKTRNGALHRREVVDRDGTGIGLYLLYARPGAVAQTLQILAKKSRDSVVLGALLRSAGALGAVAVRGMASPMIADGLMRQTGIIYHHVASTIVFSRRPDLREALRSDEAFLGGLMGEGWTRLVADEFA